MTSGFSEASRELADMITPDTGRPPEPQKIWDHVMETDAVLPGSWDATALGALDAARRREWGVCTYLAARCYNDLGGADGGVKALAETDYRVQNVLWHLGADPIVLEVPKGHEKFLVCIDGCEDPELVPTDKLVESSLQIPGISDSPSDKVKVRGRGSAKLAKGWDNSAERFKVGEIVELSQMQWVGRKLRRLVLSRDERIDLRAWLNRAETSGEGAEVPEFLSRRGTGHVPGGLFHVLSYPLAGHLDRVLLRPAERSWTESQRKAVESCSSSLGETLLGQCAKGGQWQLVETLLRAGVPFTDLTEEFADVCGSHPVVRRRWKVDLRAGGLTNSRSLMEMAADADGVQPLRGIVESLKERDELPDPDTDQQGRPPLVATAAQSQRWDILQLLLEELEVSVLPLADWPGMSRAPAEVLEIVQGRAQEERVKGRRARTLTEYFERVLAGEQMGNELLPRNFSLCDGALQHANGNQVLATGVRLGGVPLGANGQVAFVELSDEELSLASEAAHEAGTVLPLDLSRSALSGYSGPPGESAERRRVSNSPEKEKPSQWLPVLCPSGYLRPGPSLELLLRVPRNCVPTPYIPRVTVKVSVVTPCCGKAVKGVLVHFDERRAGMTDENGTVELSLPAGRHMLTAPDQASARISVDVDLNGSGQQYVQLMMDGEMFLFLQDMSFDDVQEEWMMLCANRNDLPAGAKSFTAATSSSVHSLSSASTRSPNSRRDNENPPHHLNKYLRVEVGKKCGDALLSLEAELSKTFGDRFDSNPDYLQWVENFKDECSLAMLFSGVPMRLGKLTCNDAAPQETQRPRAPRRHPEQVRTVRSAHPSSQILNFSHSFSHSRPSSGRPSKGYSSSGHLPPTMLSSNPLAHSAFMPPPHRKSRSRISRHSGAGCDGWCKPRPLSAGPKC